MTAVLFPLTLGGDNHTYSDDGTGDRDMQVGGHRTNLLPMLQQCVNMALSALTSAQSSVNAPGTNGTSVTGMTIGVGAQAFATQAGKSWVVGQPVMVANTAAPATNWMFGQITAYDAGTGNMTVNVTATAGAGTLAAWTISLCGPVISYNSSPYLPKVGAYTALAVDRGSWFECTGTWTLGFTAAATLGNGWWCWASNPGAGAVTLDPNGAETINGAATLTMQSGETWLILCTGAAFQARLITFGNTYNAKAGNYTAASSDNGGTLEFTAAATLSYTAVATLGDSWSALVVNSSSGVITHDPNGAELIAGALTASQPPGATWLVVADSGAFKVMVINPGAINQNDTAVTTAGAAPAFTFTSRLGAGIPYASPQRFRMKFHATGTTGSNTLNRDGTGAKNLMQYDATGTKVAAVVVANQLADVEADGVDYVIMDPLPPVIKQIQPISIGVAANAATFTLQPTSLDFRNSVLTNGSPNTRVLSAAASVVAPAGATLGTVSSTLARILMLALDNAGTIELGIINLTGGVNLDETGVISTTAISAAATAANVVYSTTARASVPYRVVGFGDFTEAVAGTWATAPTTVQGIGGQALAAMSSIGYGQTWQSVTRTSGTTYYNTTGKPIVLNVYGLTTGALDGQITISINGLSMQLAAIYQGAAAACRPTGNIIIPAGASYVFTSNTAANTCWELR